MADGYVRVPPDSSGKYIDTTEKYNANNVLVERQRVEIPDDVDVSGDLLTQILVEQRVQNLLLVQGLNVSADVEGLRDELSDVAGLTIPDTREILTEDRNYYVTKTGNDNNSGLSSSNAFLTLANAVTVIAAIDAAGFNVTVNVGAGTWTEADIVWVAPLSCPLLTIIGDTTTYSNVLVSVSDTSAITFASFAFDGGNVLVKGFKFVAQTITVYCLFVFSGIMEWKQCEFGAADVAHVWVDQGATGKMNPLTSTDTSYVETISGDTDIHVAAATGSLVYYYPNTVTFTGSRTWGADGYAFTKECGVIEAGVNQSAGGSGFVGTTPTGKRYTSNSNGVIAGSSTLSGAGASAGTTSNQGLAI